MNIFKIKTIIFLLLPLLLVYSQSNDNSQLSQQNNQNVPSEPYKYKVGQVIDVKLK